MMVAISGTKEVTLLLPALKTSKELSLKPAFLFLLYNSKPSKKMLSALKSLINTAMQEIFKRRTHPW